MTAPRREKSLSSYLSTVSRCGARRPAISHGLRGLSRGCSGYLGLSFILITDTRYDFTKSSIACLKAGLSLKKNTFLFGYFLFGFISINTNPRCIKNPANFKENMGQQDRFSCIFRFPMFIYFTFLSFLYFVDFKQPKHRAAKSSASFLLSPHNASATELLSQQVPPMLVLISSHNCIVMCLVGFSGSRCSIFKVQ